MTKKILSLALGAMLFALCLPAQAQQPKRVYRIGYLARGSGHGVRDKAFQRGLRELGYVEGKNIVIERRAARGEEEKLAELAAELVRLEVDVIVALHPRAARAAQKATNTIPIVIRSSGDPVAGGLVASLSRPGGNVTGVTSITSELYGKRLNLLKEVVPEASPVAVLKRAGQNAGSLREVQAAARSLGLHLQILEVRGFREFESAFRVASDSGAHALITLRNPLIVNKRKLIADLAAKSRLPAIYDEREFVDAGGLMSYGTDLAEVYHHAATYVDKILKGAKPADLPVEQPTKFELVINLKTARALGLKIPAQLLMEADKVIE